MSLGVRVLLAAFAYFGVLQGPAPAEDTSALVDRVLGAYGGWTRLATVRAYRMNGTILTGHSKPPAPTSRILVRPDKLRVSLEYPDKPERRVLNGAKGWRGDAQGLVEVQGPMLDSMLLQLARADIPWILAERRAQITACEAGKSVGRELLCLSVPLAEGLKLEAYVDPKSGLIARAITYLNRGPMVTNFDTRFSDFKPVDGVVFAFREENYAGGTHTASTTIEKIVLNPEPAPGDFR